MKLIIITIAILIISGITLANVYALQKAQAIKNGSSVNNPFNMDVDINGPSGRILRVATITGKYSNKGIKGKVNFRPHPSAKKMTEMGEINLTF